MSSERVLHTALVTGGTGTQGGATARALLAAGWKVRFLTRDPASPSAATLTALGARACRGDMNDPASLDAAIAGAEAVFSVQRPDSDGSDSERRHGFALVEAAQRAGVRHFVHTSVCEAGRHAQFPRWASGYWYQKYWTDKWDIEEAVRRAGFERWTVLKPAFLMDNFVPPKVATMFPQLRAGRLLTAFASTTRLQLLAGSDIAAFACAALLDPAQFHAQDIDLAAEALTMDEVAATLNQVLRKRVRVECVSPAEARTAGLFAGWVRMQEWINEVGYRADIAALARFGIPLTSFESWLRRHSSEVVIDG